MTLDDIFGDLGNEPLITTAAAKPTPSCDDPLQHEMTGRFHDAATALRFMLAGKAIVTLRSKATRTRFTFKLSRPKADDESGYSAANEIVFVSLLSGADNENDYQYIGHIKRGMYWHGKKSRVTADAKSNVAFDWAYRQLVNGVLPNSLEIWHEGRCGRCARLLTVPESVASGFGPECIQRIGS